MPLVIREEIVSSIGVIFFPEGFDRIRSLKSVMLCKRLDTRDLWSILFLRMLKDRDHVDISELFAERTDKRLVVDRTCLFRVVLTAADDHEIIRFLSTHLLDHGVERITRVVIEDKCLKVGFHIILVCNRLRKQAGPSFIYRTGSGSVRKSISHDKNLNVKSVNQLLIEAVRVFIRFPAASGIFRRDLRRCLLLLLPRFGDFSSLSSLLLTDPDD